MTNYAKALQLLGLAQRAGKLVSGTEGVIKALKTPSVVLVLAASDISPATERQLTTKCQQAQVPFLKIGTSQSISQALGKKRSVLALTDRGFAKSFLQSKGHTSM